MQVGIIGAGFTGLAAAIDLAAAGHQVTVFESETVPGGLAAGFSSDHWQWPLEKHYHHVFTTDLAILDLAARVGHKFNLYSPVTSIFYSGFINRFDTPISLLKYPYLTWWSKLRTACGMAFLIINPFWQPLEHITSEKFIKTVMGVQSWHVLWEPLFTGKFGNFTSEISAAWFWARIHKRSPKLAYPEGGFTALAKTMSDYAAAHTVKFNYHTGIARINSTNLTDTSGKKYYFDKVICTLPTPVFTRITSGLPADYLSKLSRLTGIGAVNLVLSLKKSLLVDGTYWLNINDRRMPFLAVVEHTNFIPTIRYNSEHLLYIGNYLPAQHKYFKNSAAQLITEFTPFLKKINPDFSPDWINNSWVWKAPFAQPIVTKNYSRLIPPLASPIPGLYLANIQQVYPWDRGTNYAVELGKQVAALCIKN